MFERITDDLDALLERLPPHIAQSLIQREGRSELLEVVMDLGRLPEARYPDREMVLSDQKVSRENIEYVVSRIGIFSGDNRAGIDGTLHRISAIRNREGERSSAPSPSSRTWCNRGRASCFWGHPGRARPLCSARWPVSSPAT